MPWSQRWEIEGEKHAEGGQGVVRKVRDLRGGQVGALKCLHPHHLNNSERRGRMAREVRALDKLAGGQIPRVLDHNMSEVAMKGEPLYVVMEWVEGLTLEHYIQGNTPSLDEAVSICLDLAKVIKRCHEKGVLHRDIKPSNVLVAPDTKRVTLIDFGLAWIDSEEEAGITSLGDELGNRFLRIADLAPRGSKRDERSDLTLVVAVLFNLLTGQSPRSLADERGQPPHIASESRFRAPLKEDPRWSYVVRVFDVGFALNIDFRFENATELIEALERALSPMPGMPGDYKGAVSAYKELMRAGIHADHQRRKREMRDTSLRLEMTLQGLAIEADLQSIHNAGNSVITTEGAAYFNLTLQQEGLAHPSVYLKHYIELTGDRKNKFRAYYQIDDGEKRTYFTGFASDFTSLRENVDAIAGQIFGECIMGLTSKIRSEAEQQIE